MSSFLSIMQLSPSLSLSVVCMYLMCRRLYVSTVFTIYYLVPLRVRIELNCTHINNPEILLIYKCSINHVILLVFSQRNLNNLYFKIHFNTSQIQTSNLYTGKGSNPILYFEVSSSFVISVQDPGFLNYVPFVILCQRCLDRCTTVIHNVG